MKESKLTEWRQEIESYRSFQQKNDQFIKLIELISPGTKLRVGLDYIVQAGVGALIVLGSSKNNKWMELGFIHNQEFNPNALYELSKMDGAIILTKNADKILYSNVHLHPNINIESMETGTRHKVAERVAKQTGNAVVAVSRRRNIVTVFANDVKYSLKYIPELLAEASQAISTFEYYTKTLRNLLDQMTTNEIKGTTTLQDVINCIIRYLNLKRILRVLERKIVELGAAGNLLKIRMEELTLDIKETIKLIRDYITVEYAENEHQVFEIFNMFSEFGLLEPVNIVTVLGYPQNTVPYELRVEPHGFRILSKIPRLSDGVIQNMIKRFGSFQKIVAASAKELVEVEGIGEVRANIIKEGILKMRNIVL